MSRAKPWPKHGSQIQRSKASTPLPEQLQRHEQKKTSGQTQNTGALPSGGDRLAHEERLGKDGGEGPGELRAHVLPDPRSSTPRARSPPDHGTALQTHEEATERSPWPPPACPISCLICPCLSTTRPVHCLSSLPPALPTTEFLRGGGSSLAKKKKKKKTELGGSKKSGLLSRLCH